MRKITGDLSKVSSMTASDTENPVNKPYLIGDPNCPICGGLGYIRKDVDITDPEFGHMTICDCRKEIVEQAANQRLIELSNLSSFNHMTFESFNPRGHVGLGEEQVNSLSYAYNQSMHFAQELKGWLLLTGGFGCGKTHLAVAIANHVVKNGIPTLFLTVPDLLDWLRFSYSGDAASFESRFEEIRTMPLLVLDDLGTQNATPWAQEKLFQILNNRYVNRLATVITTNQVVEEIDGRIQSRLLDPELVTTVKIIAPDYRSPLVDSTQPQVSALSIDRFPVHGGLYLAGELPRRQAGLHRHVQHHLKALLRRLPRQRLRLWGVRQDRQRQPVVQRQHPARLRAAPAAVVEDDGHPHRAVRRRRGGFNRRRGHQRGRGLLRGRGRRRLRGGGQGGGLGGFGGCVRHRPGLPRLRHADEFQAGAVLLAYPDDGPVGPPLIGLQIEPILGGRGFHPFGHLLHSDFRRKGDRKFRGLGRGRLSFGRKTVFRNAARQEHMTGQVHHGLTG